MSVRVHQTREDPFVRQIDEHGAGRRCQVRADRLDESLLDHDHLVVKDGSTSGIDDRPCVDGICLSQDWNGDQHQNRGE